MTNTDPEAALPEMAQADGNILAGIQKTGKYHDPKMGENPAWKGVHNLKSLDEIQTVEVDPISRERRHKDHPELWTLPATEAQTILEGLERGMKIAGEDGKFIGVPVKDDKGLVTSYAFKTYSQVRDDAQQCAVALSQLGLTPGTDFIGIFSSNNYQYDVAILGGYYINLANVSLYDTLGEEAVQHINNEAELSVVFVQNLEKLEMLLKVKSKHLKTAVVMEDIPAGATHAVQDNVNIIGWTGFMETGAGGKLVESRPVASDVATLNYTSGTTGLPKGVMLTHLALMTSGLGVGKFFICGIPLTTSDLWFSYLPLAHIFERVAHITFMVFGAQWAYSGGDMTQVVPELAVAQPTIFGAVPRTLNKLFDKISGALNEPGCVSSIKRTLIQYCMSKKRAYLDAGIVTKDTIWDRKVLTPKLQVKLGGKCHTIVCGAAPLDPEVRGFVREIFGCYFIEGYGQTENAAAGCGTMFANYCNEDGCIGVPAPWTGIKLVDVPEMNYLAAEGKGEICFRGGNLMKGYYKNEEKTKETIDKEGWLHSGDIGMWSENGQLKIIDRKKNIFKLAQGEYVAPERLEGIYAKHPSVQQIFIHGDSKEATLVAVIVPDAAAFEALGKDKAELMKQINSHAKENDKLKGFEMIRGCVIETELFSVENELLTPTQKAKRPQLLKKYGVSLEALYGEMKR